MTFTKYNEAELKFIQDTLNSDSDTDNDYNDDSEAFFDYYNTKE